MEKKGLLKMKARPSGVTIDFSLEEALSLRKIHGRLSPQHITEILNGTEQDDLISKYFIIFLIKVFLREGSKC